MDIKYNARGKDHTQDIKYNARGKDHTQDIEYFIAEYIEVEANLYPGGAVELATEHARQSSRALGRLVDVLARKGLLTAVEVAEIAGSTSDVEFAKGMRP